MLASLADHALSEVNSSAGATERKHADDRYWAMLNALSHFEAQNVDEAVIQLAWAIGLTDVAFSTVANNDAEEARDYRQIQRLIYSALRAIQREHGIDFKGTEYASLDPRVGDPWRRPPIDATNQQREASQ